MLKKRFFCGKDEKLLKYRFFFEEMTKTGEFVCSFLEEVAKNGGLACSFLEEGTKTGRNAGFLI